MSVTKVFEKWEGRGATTDDQGVQTLKRQWCVATDSDSTTEVDVIDAVIAFDASAARFASHPAYAPSICRKLTAAPHTSARQWLVDAAYSNAPFASNGDGSGSGSGSSSNPTSPSAASGAGTQADQRPPTLTVGRKEVMKALTFDVATGDAILNNIGDPFDPPIEVARTHTLITAKFCRTPAQLNWASRSLWLDSVNSDSVTILGVTYSPYTLRCIAYDLDTVWDTGAAGLAFFWSLNVQIEHNPDGWNPKVLNTGRRYLSGLGVLTEIVDQQGQPVSAPVPLNALGQPVADPAHYVYLDFAGYVDFNWNGTGGTWQGVGGILE